MSTKHRKFEHLTYCRVFYLKGGCCRLLQNIDTC